METIINVLVAYAYSEKDLSVCLRSTQQLAYSLYLIYIEGFWTS